MTSEFDSPFFLFLFFFRIFLIEIIDICTFNSLTQQTNKKLGTMKIYSNKQQTKENKTNMYKLNVTIFFFIKINKIF